jgi:DNA topoisomerase-1
MMADQSTTLPATERTLPALVQKTTPAAMAKAAGLLYVSDQQPGYRRRRRGRGFTYYDWTG